jgi:transcriptional regulator with XRE-family HTH domain
MSRYSAAYGQRVQYGRTCAELTQAQLGKKLGLGRASIANIEAGRQAQSAEQVVETAAVLKVHPAWLLIGDEDKRPAPPAISRVWLASVAEGLRASADRIEAAVEEDS